MGLFDKKGVAITTGFDYHSKAPLDSRTVVADIAERDLLVQNNAAYAGLKVYCLADKKEYLYDGTTWTSTADSVSTELNNKVDKIEGKGLSTNDYTNEEKQKVDDANTLHINNLHVPKMNIEDTPANTISLIKATLKEDGTTVLEHQEPTKSFVGLDKVDNTSDLDKPISTATQNSLNTKVDKVEGKGLSTNDYTTLEKTKLNGIETGAEVNIIEGVKINGEGITLTDKVADISVPTKTSELTNDSDYATNTAVTAANNKAIAAETLAATKTQVVFTEELPSSAATGSIVMLLEKKTTPTV